MVAGGDCGGQQRAAWAGGLRRSEQCACQAHMEALVLSGFRASSLSTRLLASPRALPGGRRAPAVRMSDGPVPFDPSHCG
eukprot:scaffold18456_cov124-Isochrysis_galbana.AAC.8